MFSSVEIPFFRILFAFALGLGLAYYFTLPLWVVLGTLACVLALCIVLRIFRLWFYGRQFLILLAFVLVGFFHLDFTENQNDALPETVALDLFQVKKNLGQSEKFNKYKVYVPAANSHVLLYAPLNLKPFTAGQWGKSSAVAQKNTASDLPQRFNYYHYLRAKNLPYTAFLQKKDSLWLSAVSPSLTSYLDEIRQAIANNIETYLGEYEVSGLFSAILLGDKSLLMPDRQEQFAHLGISHFLAVSGLHVGIIYLLISLLLGLRKYQKHRWLVPKILLAISFIWLYALISGSSPSVNRAAFMFSCFLFGRLFYRRAISINILCFCALVNLCVNPYVFQDVGFQLSYAAVAGIVLLFPKMQAILSFNHKGTNFLWDALCLSTCAQLATLPIVIYTFGFFPTWFLISNLWLALFSFALTFAAFLFIPLGFVSFIAPYFAWLAEKIYRCFTLGVDLLSVLPFSQAKIFLDHTQFMALLFLVFTGILYAVEQHKIYLKMGMAVGLVAVFWPILYDTKPSEPVLKTISQGYQRYYLYQENKAQWLFPKYYSSDFENNFVKTNADGSLFATKFRLPLQIRPKAYGETLILHIFAADGQHASVSLENEVPVCNPFIDFYP